MSGAPTSSTWPRLLAHDGFAALGMTQRVSRANGAALETTRCPIRVDGGLLTSPPRRAV